MAYSPNKKRCSVCGQVKNESIGFWLRADGSRFDVCKECAAKNADVRKPQTFLWILKDADIPFIESVWVRMCKNAYKKDPYRFCASTVIGKYLAHVGNTPKYSAYGYADTVRLNQQQIDDRAVANEMKAKAKDALKDRVEDESEVSKEIETMFCGEGSELNELPTEPLPMPEPEPEPELLEEPAPKDEKELVSKSVIPSIIQSQAKQEYVPPVSIDEQKILSSLTPEDEQMLALKWGESFLPSEWLKMEDMFQRYSEEYDMNVDREETLKAMCKTNVNMQRCLDSGDAANASKFSTMFDQLRKSGAFTEAQKKEEKDRYLDSVGELVAAVEREGGIIPRFNYAVDAPEDKVDLTLKDMESYTYNLVKNEMGLGDLIEAYVKKLEEELERDKDRSLMDGLITSRDEEQELQNDIEADNWLAHLEDDIAADADEMYAKIGGE